ncbi:MetQ/NlpA family ABC transporter substrate-binding protein [Neisseria meningitidis]|uniref:MetQ/NlpA family ABC transporter substrate-binding protein n=1 Tax=Neisseria meningitidis TaxID=487 RepID=UPI00076670FA|nr:MetQ/NlpA family ABC transporter substrate-binding protein [Neisseria meningitidis]CWO44984.1 outer membrane lipoprotein GNA1946 [Neisseria meningitidis]CWO80183.1 outer membrane lipoprotein GNA1946 [Neisseria meningitidis]CWP50179.1 outer membrane lipoprotein GNA1946 [Neisseria meningitidis]CWS49893.1 outer membrane lipoprotein GNA1946 [Neisseria meningitidis]CWS80790.1 outer membrane lipoprotein GNA1946 [Neisseria meningitidis]
MKTFFKTLSAAALALILAACGGQKDSAPAASASAAAGNGAAKKEIVFGTTVGDFGDMVKEQIQAELEKKGYTVKLVEFTDYVRPNLALAEGELDINVFQHKPYLDDFKKEHNLDITEVFQVPTAPLGLYPGKLKSLEEVKDGSTVSAPNDPSNFARVLVMLDELGWIKLKDGINPLTASKADIAENLKNIKIVELEAAQLPRSRADVDFAVVNGNYAISSGMKLTEALFQEPSFAYVNWSAVKTADKDSQWLKDVTEAYNSDAFKAYAHKRFEGYKSPAAWNEGAAK